MKIVLVQCPIWGTLDPPMALVQLSGCLRDSGHEVSIFDMNIKLYLSRSERYKNFWAWEQSDFWHKEDEVSAFFNHNKPLIEECIAKISAINARVVCFSVSSASRISSLKVAQILKNLTKDIVVVFGGPLFLDDKTDSQILQTGYVDVVVHGEGEYVLPELLNYLDSGFDLSKVRGLCFRKNSQIINTGLRKSIDNLDALPFLDFSDLSLKDYDNSEHIAFMSSRGCVQRCVFCSSRSFWPGYRTMSGERIFREIEYHKKQQAELNVDIRHVDFLDLLFNGNIKTLVDFCNLMRQTRLSVEWTANMIFRKELTSEVIKGMKDARCAHVIFGIESGSQRVLDLMQKNYRVEDADNIIRYMHEAGITVTGNFMFGFPGETAEDFQKTLIFLKRNAKFLDRVYPSRTYCAIEKNSYLHEHMDKFDIKPNPPNHLYWESKDGSNIYPERFRRCDEFCKFASSLGVEVGCGVQASVDLDKWHNLFFYYDSKKDYINAVNCLLNYYDLDPQNEEIREKIVYYRQMLENEVNGFTIVEPAVERLKKINLLDKESRVNSVIHKLTREKSVAMSKNRQRENSRLIKNEYELKNIVLQSPPTTLFLQAAGPCNASCVFCSKGKDYEFFDLATYKKRIESKIFSELDKLETIVLTGSGEFLNLPEREEILSYFDDNFYHVEKMFSTNGSGLDPKICDLIANGKSRYTIHVSLHASNAKLHSVLTRMDSFYRILGQVERLIKLKKKTENVNINLVFVATTLNIHDLPNFIRLAAQVGADKVICYYNYIYVPAQKYLSCFFKQEFTNQMLEEAKKLGEKYNLSVALPPKFGQKSYPVQEICREPWSQIMLDAAGKVLPCDAAEDCGESLENADFMYIWNSSYYQNLRKSLVEAKCSCFQHCFRANPKVVNDFASHVIHRGNNMGKIDVEWGNNV